MKKEEIQNILLSMKTPENEITVNELMDKIRVMDEETLQETVKHIGGTKENITKFLQQKIVGVKDTQKKRTCTNQ